VKTCIIGDIHGCHGPLSALLELVDDQECRLVFLGDYIDRGPDSRRVLETLIQLKSRRPDTVFLRGNHEFMLLLAMDDGPLSLFLDAGGRQTLASYGLSPDADDPLAELPREHLRFLADLPLLHEDEHGIYVHAGIDPRRHLSMQGPDWCLWARDRFIRARLDLDRPVVFGHTPFAQPLVQDDKIGIDTGAVYGGHLTGLLLPDRIFFQVPGEQHHPWPGTLR